MTTAAIIIGTFLIALAAAVFIVGTIRATAMHVRRIRRERGK